MARTAAPGVLFYSRLIPIRDVFMTSGVSFGFNPGNKNKLLDDISAERFKKRRKLNSADLLLLSFKKSKSYGIKTVWDEIT